MLDSIRRFFNERISRDMASDSSEASDHALRLAAAALLFEVVRADAEVREEERTVMRTAIQSAFALDAAEADELVGLAEEESRRAVSVYEFTSLVDRHFAPEQKKRVVELLWLVAFADAEKHAQEEALVRKIAGLLHVPHPDFIDAKRRARSASEAGGE
jgi:uncharacterized tellurite resistance protein B-like protein